MAGEIAKEVADAGIAVCCCRAKTFAAAANPAISIREKRLLKMLLKSSHGTRSPGKSPLQMTPRFGERIARHRPRRGRNFPTQPAAQVGLPCDPVTPEPIPAFQRKRMRHRVPRHLATGARQHSGNKAHHQPGRNHPSLEQERKQHRKRPAATRFPKPIGAENALAPELPSVCREAITDQRSMENQKPRLAAMRACPQFKVPVKGLQRRRVANINRRRR